MKTVTVPIGHCNCPSCSHDLENGLSAFSAIAQVYANYVTQTATITFDETQLSVTHLRELVEDCGFGCGDPLALSATKPAAALSATPPGISVQTLPSPAEQLATTCEHGVRHAARQRRSPEPRHAMTQDMHDMSNPDMAAAMEAGMERRFWIALILTVPIALYSSFGTSVLHLHLPTPFGVNRN